MTPKCIRKVVSFESTKESKEFKAYVAKQSQKLDAQVERSEDPQERRPFNHIESNAVITIWAIAEFCDVLDTSMARRTKTIKGCKSRLGMLRWTARKLFEDYVHTIPPETASKFMANAALAQLRCATRNVSENQVPDYNRVVWEDDLHTLVDAAYHGVCEMCDKTGRDAKQCGLKKVFDAIQMPNTGDNKDCWYKE